jgi:hypothetical protein
MSRLHPLTGKLEDDRGVCHSPKPIRFKDRSSFRLTGWFRSSAPFGEGTEPSHLRVMLDRQMINRQWMDGGANRVLWGIVVVIFLVSGAVALFQSKDLAALAAVFMLPILKGMDIIDRRQFHARYQQVAELPPACLACLYELSGCPTDADGCTVCPECGAAWRLKA